MLTTGLYLVYSLDTKAAVVLRVRAEHRSHSHAVAFVSSVSAPGILTDYRHLFGFGCIQREEAMIHTWSLVFEHNNPFLSLEREREKERKREREKKRHRKGG